MAQVYRNKDVVSNASRIASDLEASKVDDSSHSAHASDMIQEAKNSDENSSRESNVIRVTANEMNCDIIDQECDSEMEIENDSESERSSD